MKVKITPTAAPSRTVSVGKRLADALVKMGSHKYVDAVDAKTDEETKPKARKRAAKKRAYKRRDMTAED